MTEWGPKTFPELLRFLEKRLPKLTRTAVGAANKADAAQSTADAAMESADGKNTIFFRDVAPTAEDPGAADGDIWFVVPNTNTGIVTGQYVWDASTSTWIQQTLDSQIIASLDAGKITVGTLSGIDITGVTITGSTVTGGVVQTGSTGKRAVLGGNLIRFYDENNNQAGQIEGLANGASGGILRIGPNGGDNTTGMYVGTWSLPLGTAGGFAPSFYIAQAYADKVINPANGHALLDETDWINLPVVGSSGYSSDPTLRLQYRRIGQMVSIRGQINRTTNIASGLMAQLPAGFQPSQNRYFLCPGAGNVTARVLVDTAGWFNPTTISGSSTYLILDVISFMLN